MSEPKIQIKSNINLALQEIEFETKVMDHIQNETLSFREEDSGSFSYDGMASTRGT